MQGFLNILVAIVIFSFILFHPVLKLIDLLCLLLGILLTNILGEKKMNLPGISVALMEPQVSALEKKKNVRDQDTGHIGLDKEDRFQGKKTSISADFSTTILASTLFSGLASSEF